MGASPRDRRVLRLHGGLVLAVCLCGSGFFVELWRAESGNELSWAYVVIWPLLLVYGVVMWHRLVRDARGLPRPEPRSGRAAQRRAARTAREDDERREWNRYLGALHERDAQRDARSSSGKTAASTPFTKRGDASVE